MNEYTITFARGGVGGYSMKIQADDLSDLRNKMSKHDICCAYVVLGDRAWSIKPNPSFRRGEVQDIVEKFRAGWRGTK